MTRKHGSGGLRKRGEGEEGGGRGTYNGVAGTLGAVGVMLTTRAALRATPSPLPEGRVDHLELEARTSEQFTSICDIFGLVMRAEMTGKRSEKTRTSDVYNAPREMSTPTAARSAAPSPPRQPQRSARTQRAGLGAIDVDLRIFCLRKALKDA